MKTISLKRKNSRFTAFFQEMKKVVLKPIKLNSNIKKPTAKGSNADFLSLVSKGGFWLS